MARAVFKRKFFPKVAGCFCLFGLPGFFWRGSNRLPIRRMSSRSRDQRFGLRDSGPDRFIPFHQSERLANRNESGRDIGALEATSRTPTGRPLLVTGRAHQPPKRALSKGRP